MRRTVCAVGAVLLAVSACAPSRRQKPASPKAEPSAPDRVVAIGEEAASAEGVEQGLTPDSRITGARGYTLPEVPEEASGRTISLTVKDAELEDVIRLLARHAGLNLVLNPADVRGRVTVELHNVSALAALRAILRSHGLEMIRDPGTTHRVTPRGRVQANAAVEKVVVHVPLNWVSAAEVKKTLDPHVGGEIVADTLTNSIIIAGPAGNVENIVRLIRGTDRENQE